MAPCPECGNSDVATTVIDGLAVHECGLCAALFGDPRAVDAVQGRRAAEAAGVDPRVWPVVSVLNRQPGLRVVRSHGGDSQAATLPFVQVAIQGVDGLLQLENLAKSLLVAARGHLLHWVVEVEYQSRLLFALKPRHGGGPIAAAVVQDAWLDLERIGRELARDVKLSWWSSPGRA
ncbi:MAG: hypothetical protein IPK26_23990 [Planctomycetes bacterium]|nr:hypothetical protein [Planctomycetota bacterium]